MASNSLDILRLNQLRFATKIGFRNIVTDSDPESAVKAIKIKWKLEATRMGGQASRMVREIMEDSMYIMRQTNRNTYMQSVNARQEVEGKLQDLRAVREEMLESVEQDASRAQVFEQFGSVTSQKKTLDDQAEGFARQFELPKQFQTIADKHTEEMKKAAKQNLEE